MIKWFLLIVIFLLIVYIGYGIFKYYKKRENLFKDLCDFSNRLSEEINFLKTDLISIVNKISNNYNYDFNDILSQYSNFLKNINHEKFEVDCSILSADEKEDINSFFNNLGRSGLEEQKVCIAYYKSRFNEQYGYMSKEKETNGVVGFKLCIVLALLVCIVLI